MSKVLVDRALLERAVYALQGAYERDMLTTHDLQAVLDAPSGTPMMPVKAYYHESPNEYGGLNKSVGLEVRKTFIDAPLVLESDALAQIACLEGEITKRDARIMEIEADLAGTQSRVLSLQNQWRKLDAELAALKAQEPVATIELIQDGQCKLIDFDGMAAAFKLLPGVHDLYAAPVSEAKAQGVVMPEPMKRGDEGGSGEYGAAMIRGYNACLREVARLNAAPAAPAADAGLVEALEEIVAADWASSETATDFAISQTKGFLISKIKDIARAALATRRAEGVV